jgi:hypothetical protein
MKQFKADSETAIRYGDAVHDATDQEIFGKCQVDGGANFEGCSYADAQTYLGHVN